MAKCCDRVGGETEKACIKPAGNVEGIETAKGKSIRINNEKKDGGNGVLKLDRSS